jgi:hypothetical protein
MAVPGPFFRNVSGTPASPQFARFTLKGHTVETDGLSRPTWNVYNFRGRSSNVNPSALSLGNAYMGQIIADLSAALSTSYVADPSECKFLDDPALMPVTIANGIVGAIGGDRMPSGNGCVTIRLRCNAAGRNFTGSKHFSPIAESDTTLDQLNAGAQGRWNAVAVHMLASPVTDADGNEWDLIVLSSEESDLTISPAKFTGAYVVDNPLNLRVGTMRRRRQRSSPTI